MNLFSRLAVVFFIGLAALPRLAAAADYNLAAGETDTISTNVTYGAVSVEGALTVNKGAGVKCTSGTLAGGTILVDGTSVSSKRACFTANSTLLITNNASGAVGQLSAVNGSAASANNQFIIKKLDIRLDEGLVTPADGCFKLAELSSSRLSVGGLYNYSTLTARVDVTAQSRWLSQDATAFFREGSFLFNVSSSQSISFDVGSRKSSLNDADVAVQTKGAGNVNLNNDSNSTANPLHIRRGAFFNHSGALGLDGSGYYQFDAGAENAIGSNVSKIYRYDTANTPHLHTAAGVTLNVPCNIDLLAKSVTLTGSGTLNLDCSQKALSCKVCSNASPTLSKTGAYEATIVSTNVAHVRVQEGVMRFNTYDCTVGDLTTEAGASVVADGVSLFLPLSGEVEGLSAAAENGGEVVFAGSGVISLVEPRFEGKVRVASGSVDFQSSVLPANLVVDAGASVAFTNCTAEARTIGALTLEAGRAYGTIYGGKLVEKGFVDLSNFDVFNAETKEIAIDFEGTEGIANLAKWKVCVNGVVYPDFALSYDTTAKKLTVSGDSYVHYHVTATTADDLQTLYPNQGVVLEVDTGVYFTNTVALTGSHSIVKTGLGRLVLSQSSPDFTGGLTIVSGYLDGRVNQAYGKGTVYATRTNDTTCLIYLGSTAAATTYDNDFVFRPAAGCEHSTKTSFYAITSGVKAITLNGDVTSYGDLIIDDSTTSKPLGTQGKNLVTFNGKVTVESYMVSYACDNDVYWKGPLVCNTFKAVAGYPVMGSHYLYSSQNRIGEIYFYYNKILVAGAEALGGAKITFYSTPTSSGNARGMLALDGYDQHVACLTGVQNTSEKRYINYNSNAVGTLTLTGGVERAQTNVRLGSETDGKIYGKFALTVDAGNDDFVQEFTNTIVYTSGDITVKNGTLLFTGTSSMRYTKNLNVDGGRLDLDVTAVNACSNVTAVAVGSNAVLRIGTSAATPFVDGTKTQLTLDKDATLELPEGAAATVNRVFVGRRKIAAGVYTGSEGAGDGVKVLPQITGAGRLTVLKGGGLVIVVR